MIVYALCLKGLGTCCVTSNKKLKDKFVKLSPYLYFREFEIVNDINEAVKSVFNEREIAKLKKDGKL